MLILLVFISSPFYADPIHFAAQTGNIKVLKKLIEKKKIPVDTRLKTGETPLILAAGSADSSAEVLLYLISQGADVKAFTPDGWTALMSASRRNFTAKMSILLEQGADPMVRTKFGEDAFILAVQNGSIEAATLLASSDASLLNKTTANGTTPLMTAVESENPNLVRFLLDYGASIDAQDKRGYTALMYINQMGSIEAIGILIEYGANVNKATPEGWTALMEAANQNRKEVVYLLLLAGADKNLKDQFGRTALDIAKAKGHNEIISLLTNPLTMPLQTY